MENILNCLRATYRAVSSVGEEKEGGREKKEDQKGGLQHTTTLTTANRAGKLDLTENEEEAL